MNDRPSLRSVLGERRVSFDTETTSPATKLDFTIYDDIELAPKKTWTVESFYGSGELVCTFGSPSAGKSVLVGDKNAHVAAGRKWFGRVVSCCAVLHVAAERAAVAKRRYAAFREHHGIDSLPLAITSKSVNLCSSFDDAKAIVEACKRLEDAKSLGVGLLSIETVNRILSGGDENSPKDMGALVDKLAFLQEQTGATVEIVHHIPADGTQRLRGHGALLGACDTTLRVEKTGGVRACTVDKSNDGPEGERFCFDLISVELHRDAATGLVTTAPVVIPVEAPIVTNGAGKPNLTANQNSMLNILADAGSSGLSLDEWNAEARASGLGVKRPATLVDCRLTLKRKHLVHNHADRWYVTN
jgi:hypothetical protein